MQVLREIEAEDFLEKNGFEVSKRKFARNLLQAVDYASEVGMPVALKIVGKGILHKSDVGGVKLDLRNEEEIKKAFKELREINGFEGVLVQEFFEGHFVLIGLKKDETFGHSIAVGFGGIYTEIIKDVSFRVCPITFKDGLEMLEELKLFKLLKGVRGDKSVDIKKLVKILVKISKLPLKYKEIDELDINPLIINDKKMKIADARIVFR